MSFIFENTSLPASSRKTLPKRITTDILRVYDREVRLHGVNKNLLDDPDVITKAIEFVATKYGMTLQKSTIRVLLTKLRITQCAPLPQTHRALPKKLVEFIISRFDRLQIQGAAAMIIEGGTIPAIFREVRKTKDVHIMHLEIMSAIEGAGRQPGHVYLPKLRINVKDSFCNFVHDELMARAMEDEEDPIAFALLGRNEKEHLMGLMRQWTGGEMRNNDWWLNQIMKEAGELMGFDTKEYPKHVTVVQERFLAVRERLKAY